MTTIVLFTITLAALPLAGAPAAMLPAVRALHPLARFGIAVAAASVTLSLLFTVTPLLGISGAFPLLVSTLLVLGIAVLVTEWRRWRRAEYSPHGQQDDSALERRSRSTTGALAGSAVALGALTWAAMTAQITSTDLLLFWGTKAARFLAAGGVDFQLLSHSDLRFLHADYPPLVPLLLAAGGSFSGFSWFGALALAPLFTAFAVLTFHGFATTKRLPVQYSAAMTTGLAALVCATTAISLSAGNAEPVLLFFEVLTLCGMIFCSGTAATFTVALALTGAVLTKVEGTAFAALALFAFTVTRSVGIGRAIVMAAAPAALLGGWVAIVITSDIGGESYRGTLYGAFTMRHLGSVVRTLAEEASFDLWYLPWIVAAIPLIAAWRHLRAALPCLLLAATYTVFIIYCYLHGQSDPVQWMRWSAMRLLMTPMVVVYFAGVAALVARATADAARRDVIPSD